MSEQSETKPQPEQLARANRLHEAISKIKRGIRPGPKTPRDLTERAAAEVARQSKPGSR